MNLAHAHLLLNHVPVIGAILGVLLFVLAMILRRVDVARSGLFLLLIAGVMVVPAYLTGEPAEHIVEGAPGVTEQYIEPHEEAAKFALIAVASSGVLALFGLVAYRRAERLPGWFNGAILVVGLLACVTIGRTALLGGDVRHTEIRAGAQPAQGQPGGGDGD